MRRIYQKNGLNKPYLTLIVGLYIVEAPSNKENRMKKRVCEFLDFVREQGVIGLAVGLAIGTAAGATVKSIVDNLIAPLVALITRGIELDNLKWVIIPADGGSQAEVAIGYGAIISSTITLLATAFVVYELVRIFRLNKLDKKKKKDA